MLRFRFTLQVLCQLVLSSCLIAVATAQAKTAGTASPPANSIDRQFGSGWDCARGYKRIANACDLVAVPENAYLDASKWIYPRTQF